MEQLPELRKIVAPALATFVRKIKVPTTGIHIEKRFSKVYVVDEKLQGYRSYFSFNEELPLCYLYLLAQRAQGAIMLQKEYTMPIPGTVHLSNELRQIAPIDAGKPFELYASLEVPYVSEGSLKPSIVVSFFQEGNEVAHCQSGYLVKRKKKKGSQQRRPSQVFTASNAESQEWVLSGKVGKEYASISDDHNPIHKSGLAAKVLGFKKPIAHGWFLVSKAISEGVPDASNIHVSFERPVLLPGTYKVYQEGESEGRKAITICGTKNNVLTRITAT